MTFKKRERKKGLRLGKEERVNAAKSKMKTRMGPTDAENELTVPGE